MRTSVKSHLNWRARAPQRVLVWDAATPRGPLVLAWLVSDSTVCVRVCVCVCVQRILVPVYN